MRSSRRRLLGVSCDLWQHPTSFSEFHRSMGLSCSASSVEIKTQNSPAKPSISDQRKAYSLPWEKQTKQVHNSRTCCFCWCCLCTCLCKSRIIRGTKISAIDSDPSFSQIDVDDLLDGLKRPPLEKVYEWAEDFESLIRDEVGRLIFERFLQQEYSDENLLFWLEVEKLKKIEMESDRRIIAKSIYKTFIEPRSEKEVNIEFRIRKSIEQGIECPSSELFEPAQTQVYVMMYRQSYPRFLSSRMYKSLLMLAVGKQDKEQISSEQASS